MQTITFGKCTKDLLKNTFGLHQLWDSEILTQWFDKKETITVDDAERNILNRLKNTLMRKSEDWNETELSEYFIGPLISLVDFNTDYFSAFSDRTIEAEIDDYKLTGKPDMMVAKGEDIPKIPYFCFQEYKKQIEPEGNPTYQALGEMLVAAKLNIHSHPIYGVSVIVKMWHFIILHNTEFCVSKGFLADDNEIFDIFKILRALKVLLIEIAKKDI
jgi:hypothetical protein